MLNQLYNTIGKVLLAPTNWPTSVTVKLRSSQRWVKEEIFHIFSGNCYCNVHPSIYFHVLVHVSFLVAKEGFCSSPWIHYNGHCFYVNRTQKTWSDAQRNCRNLGGDLVSIHNVEEQSFIISQLGYGMTK